MWDMGIKKSDEGSAPSQERDISMSDKYAVLDGHKTVANYVHESNVSNPYHLSESSSTDTHTSTAFTDIHNNSTNNSASNLVVNSTGNPTTNPANLTSENDITSEMSSYAHSSAKPLLNPKHKDRTHLSYEDLENISKNYRKSDSDDLKDTQLNSFDVPLDSRNPSTGKSFKEKSSSADDDFNFESSEDKEETTISNFAKTRHSISALTGPADAAHRAPLWLPRALLEVIVAAFIAWFIWIKWQDISWIVFDVIIALFLALALEPMVEWFIKRGLPRPLSSLLSGVIVLVCCGGFIWAFGQLLIAQISGLVFHIPALYNQISDYIVHLTGLKVPSFSEVGYGILRNWKSSWTTVFAGTALTVTSWLLKFSVSLMIVLFVTYYMSSCAFIMRRTVCSLLPPQRQKKFLVVWSVLQTQVSSYLSTRVILAIISSCCMAIYMIFTHVPYWLPLCLMYAIISQFIPMIGGIIGAILPVAVVWGNQGIKWALFLALYILIYQQIENIIIAPKVQQKTMFIQPAIGLLSVFFFGALFGAVGAFLALPIVGSIQIIFRAYFTTQPLVNSPILWDTVPKKKLLKKVIKSAKRDKRNLLDVAKRSVPHPRRQVFTTDDLLRAASAQYDEDPEKFESPIMMMNTPSSSPVKSSINPLTPIFSKRSRMSSMEKSQPTNLPSSTVDAVANDNSANYSQANSGQTDFSSLVNANTDTTAHLATAVHSGSSYVESNISSNDVEDGEIVHNVAHNMRGKMSLEDEIFHTAKVPHHTSVPHRSLEKIEPCLAEELWKDLHVHTKKSSSKISDNSSKDDPSSSSLTNKQVDKGDK